MPGYDRSGPMGYGPRTGGGFGFCRSSAPAGGQWNRGFGRGLGAGRGGGRGGRWGDDAFGRRNRRFWQGPWDFGARPYPEVAPEAPVDSAPEEKAYLNFQAQRMREELAAIERRLAAIEKETDDSAGRSV
jgi:hypothetical protein